MYPVLLKIGPLNIYSYGVMAAIGFSLVVFLVCARASSFGLDRNKIIDYLIFIFISGIIGARVMFVLLNFEYYRANPMEILNLSKGGLVWYGGFAAAVLASVWFIKKRGLDFWTVADLTAPYIALGQAFGRIGCYLNGCCYGAPAPSYLPFGERYPTQIFSAMLLFIIFVVLIKRQSARRFKGEIFTLYCALYACKRFFIEFLRGDNPKLFFELTISQVISAVIFITILFAYKMMADKWKKKILSGSR